MLENILLLIAALVANPLSPGDRLYELGLYEAATTEFLRELHAGTPDSGRVRMKLAFSRAAAGELEPAAAEFRRLVEHPGPAGPAAALALAGVFAARGRYERARFELEAAILHAPDSNRTGLEPPLAWLELSCGDLAAAGRRYANLDRADVAERLSRPPARRSPVLAGALSSFLPGTGEAYAGRPAHGLLSLLVTGAGATGTWYAARSGDWLGAGLVFSLTFLRFYRGSQSNAADLAEEFNRAALRNYVARLAAETGLEPDWFGPAELLTGLSGPVIGRDPFR